MQFYDYLFGRFIFFFRWAHHNVVFSIFRVHLLNIK